uniref:Uncharacterized protein n=1 Tax=Romanomermis culicivorax TaxID=13658 RepID=A0A915K2L5_ROMCU
MHVLEVKGLPGLLYRISSHIAAVRTLKSNQERGFETLMLGLWYPMMEDAQPTDYPMTYAPRNLLLTNFGLSKFKVPRLPPAKKQPPTTQQPSTSTSQRSY